MSDSPFPSRRIAAIDVARGVALLAMASFHFSWDLEFFGYLEPGTTGHGFLKLYARSIASSFLFLVGVSLFLAHAEGIRWNGFWKRFVLVAGAAALISLATFLAMREEWIFFGILHEIAFASLAGLLFLRLPSILTLALAAGFVALPFFFKADLFNHPALWWVGLSTALPRSNDYVPVFPWFGAVLAGIGIAKLAAQAGFFPWLAGNPPRGLRPLAFLGRHSLLFYLLHQPVLIGCVWLFSQVFPPVPQAPEARFSRACARNCEASRDEAFCAPYCSCMLDQIQAGGLMSKVFGSDADPQTKAQLQDMAGICAAGADTSEEQP